MIKVSINGEIKKVQAESTLSQVLAQSDFELSNVAVAVNCEFVPKQNYETKLLVEGDKVDILTAVQGG